MRKCPYCEKEIQERNAKFCPHCQEEQKLYSRAAIEEIAKEQIKRTILFWCKTLSIAGGVFSGVLIYFGWFGLSTYNDTIKKINTQVASISNGLEHVENKGVTLINIKASEVTSNLENNYQTDSVTLATCQLRATMSIASDLSFATNSLSKKLSEAAGKMEELVANYDDLSHRLQCIQATNECLKCEQDGVRTQLFAFQSQVSGATSNIKTQESIVNSNLSIITPQVRALQDILTNKNAADIFNKLQQEFSRINTLELRVTYEFLPTAETNILRVPFQYAWLRTTNTNYLALFGGGDIQFYKESDNEDTTVSGRDSFSIITKYHMFAPFEMGVENQPISKRLKAIQTLSLECPDPSEFDSSDVQDYYSACNCARGMIKSIHVQILLNGFSGFDYVLQKDAINWPLLETNVVTAASKNRILISVSKDFQDPFEQYVEGFTKVSP